jgi:hypothetical protein
MRITPAAYPKRGLFSTNNPAMRAANDLFAKVFCSEAFCSKAFAAKREPRHGAAQ